MSSTGLIVQFNEKIEKRVRLSQEIDNQYNVVLELNLQCKANSVH